MGVVKREEEKMQKILARSKAAAKKEAEEKKAAKRKGKGGKGKQVVSASGPGNLSLEEKKALRAKYSHIVTSAETGPKETVQEPPFSYEVHGRRNTITVTVTLHKIPDQYINIDETTARKFVVDTSKFTKKFRLDFDFPSGMKVNTEEADYTLESGILKAVFPIDNMPDSVAEENKKLLESVKADRKMRFKYDQNGDLQVRKRKAALAVPPTTEGNKKGKESRGKRNREDEEEGAEAPAATNTTSIVDKKQTGGAKNKKQQQPATQTSSTVSLGTGDSAAGKKKNPKKAFVSDDGMSKLIKETAIEASKSTKKKQMEAEARTKRAAERSEVRDQKHAQKKDQMNQSFASLINNQKKKLQERLAMAAPVQPRTKSGEKKFVHFA